ncbi:hypothetical protein PENSPDRAFT_752360 [Peniophora sp. CONT]|nr:hypothetical protein PENSPDRAFT_752360 [Peniophora sp. CONT]
MAAHVNPVFTAVLGIVALAIVAYVFFWNNFFGSLLGFFLRVAYWNQGEDSIWVEIGSIHFSLIAGRVLFKDVKYHSSNQTIKIVKGQISWRYWIRSPTDEREFQMRTEGPGKQSIRASDCRIHLALDGLEWRMYNRTAAFDYIAQRMEEKRPNPPRTPRTTPRASLDGATSALRNVFSKHSMDTDGDGPPDPTFNSSALAMPDWVRRAADWIRGQLPDLDPKSLLPLSFYVRKGIITCGNISTPSLLVAEFTTADGAFGNLHSRSPLDLYKQVLDITFEKASLNFMENEFHDESMAGTGERIHDELETRQQLAMSPDRYLIYRLFSKLWRNAKLHPIIALYRHGSRGRSANTHSRFRFRRAKSVEQDTPVGIDFSTYEYAQERTILEAPVLSLSYYVDVVGTVPCDPAPSPAENFDVGNGGDAPEWGIDLVIHGGFLRYGPWADRQRADLQRAFFPPTYQDAEPTPRLSPGDNRTWTAMRIFMELRQGTTVYIPFREPSKDWQWDGLYRGPRPRRREAASLSIKAGDDSTISYLMPMVSGAEGFRPLLEVHLDSVTVSSSLNDIRLLNAQSCRIQADMHSPLQWNASRVWRFGISLRQPILFLLRDHVNMLTDLGKDWSTGPPSAYATWVPVTYAVDVDMRNYELNLYVNDHNIIDKPQLREENAIMTLRGSVFKNDSIIPSDKYRPLSTTIPFNIEAPNVMVSLTLPKWSTHSLLASEPVETLGRFERLRLEGSYQYFSDRRVDNIERLRLNFITEGLIFKALGWSIRYFMILQENYFGSFTHFTTIHEYLDRRDAGHVGDPVVEKYREGSSNMMQVELEVTLDKCLMYLPAGIVGFETCNPDKGQLIQDIDLGGAVVLSIPELQIVLNVHEYGMEVALNFGTIHETVLEHITEREIYATPTQWRPATEQLHIDGFNVGITALYGPQPLTSSYMWMWEVQFGDIKGSLSSADARTLGTAFGSFWANFKDPFNAPAADYAIQSRPDGNFYKISLAGIDLMSAAGDVAMQLCLPSGLRLDTNDLATDSYKRVISVQIPEAVVRCLRRCSSRDVWVEAGEVRLDALLDVYMAPPHWQEGAAKQAEYMAEQDQKTGRLIGVAETPAKMWTPAPYHCVYTTPLRFPRLPVPNKPRRPSLTSHVGNSEAKIVPGRPAPLALRQSYLSDSDEEAGMKESDRDLRLANSRPSSAMPAIVTEDHAESDIGDESDDADLSDGSESYWSELEDDAKPLDVLTQRYAALTRRYAASGSTRPSRWAKSAFTLLKERSTIHIAAATKSESQDARDTTSVDTWQPRDVSDDCGLTKMRIKSGLVEAWINPLLPSSIAEFMESESQPATPESRLDNYLDQHVDRVVAQMSPARDTSTVIDLAMSSVKLRLLQFTTPFKPSRHSHLSPQMLPSSSSELAVTLVELGISGIHAKAQTFGGADVDSRPSFTMLVQNSSLALGSTSDSSLRTRPHHVLQSALAGSLDGFTAALASDRVSVFWNTMDVSMDHSVGRHLLDVVVPYLQPALEAAQTFPRVSQKDEHLAQLQLYHILKWSSEHPVVDMLSTNQPSYLVQTGRPQALRISPLSKLLVHLRASLSGMSLVERKEVVSAASLDVVPPREEMAALLDGQIGQLLGFSGEADISSTDLLGRLFPSWSLPESKSSHTELPIMAVEIVYRVCRLSILDPSGGSACHIGSTGLRVDIQMKTMDLHPVAPSRKAEQGRLVMYRHVVCSVGIDGVDVLVLPHLLHFVQRSLSLRSRVEDVVASIRTPSSTPSTRPPSPVVSLVRPALSLYGDFSLTLGNLRVQIAEEKLVLVYSASRFAFVTNALQRQSSPGKKELSVNSSLLFDSISLAAHSVTTRGAPLRHRDLLAEFSVSKSSSNVVFRHEAQMSPSIRGLVNLGLIRLSVPRSAIRLVKFIEEWREDYLPVFEKTIQAILSEVRSTSKPTKSPTLPSSPPRAPREALPIVHVQLVIPVVGVSLHIMPGTWFSWDVHDLVSYARSTVTSTRKASRTFGLQITSQRISVSSSDGPRGSSPAAMKLKLDLPSFTFTGYYEKRGIHFLASVGLFNATVKPKHWDMLLAVQKKFGTDFDDLVHVLADARRKRHSATTPVGPHPDTHPTVPAFVVHSASVKMKGFRIGLDGQTSTMLFECQDIHGGLDSGVIRSWNVYVSGLALSLAPRTTKFKKAAPFSRHHRSAFLIIDFKVAMGEKGTGEKDVRVVVDRIHGVLQPSSIGEIGDFVDYIQAEVLARQEEREKALSEFREKTREVMRSFDVRGREKKADSSPASDDGPTGLPSWLREYSIDFTVKNIGAAFPLALDGSLELPHSRSAPQSHVKAFLFSIKSVAFGVERNGSGLFRMQSFSFQFVDRFRQSHAKDFLGDNHSTRNRMLYPDMTAQIRNEVSNTSRRLRIQASVSGFILDLDSSIADHVFSLVDVYRQGKERLERLAANNPRPSGFVPPKPPKLDIAGNAESGLPTFNILLHLVFLSGKLQMHSETMRSTNRSTMHEAFDLHPSDQPEVFSLPILTVWGEYRASNASSRKRSGSLDVQPSSLVFKSTVHSSENTLRPTLLPFISELVNKVETRLRNANQTAPRVPTTPVPVPKDLATVTSVIEDSPASSLQMTFALRIDQSKLQLTCQPDVNVVAGIHWDSGGFVVNVSSGARQVSFMANVSGLTIGLKHGFLSEDCVRLDARNLVFSVSFSHLAPEGGERFSYVSVAVDTVVSGAVKFSRLQDVLCFKAVWLDRIPVFNPGVTVPGTPASTDDALIAPRIKLPRSASPGSTGSGQDLITAIAVRVRSVQLDADLGQSISNVRMDMRDVVFRTKLADSASEFSLDVAELNIDATGNLTGRVRMPDFVFRTVRRKNPERHVHATKMLELSLKSGTLEASLESDYQKILQLWARPLHASVMDDWSQMSREVPLLERLLKLSFAVSGEEIVLVSTVTTIPKLMSYANRFTANLAAQREGAIRESRAFRAAQAPKPDNPLSAVANAMLQQARTKFREAPDEGSSFAQHVIQQRMHFELKSLRLVVFPRTMTDFEMAHFAIRGVTAQLETAIESALRPAVRRLHLGFASMSTSRVSQLNHTTATLELAADVAAWLAALRKGATENTIFDLPAMDMKMNSEEHTRDGGRKVLEYDFFSKFVRNIPTPPDVNQDGVGPKIVRPPKKGRGDSRDGEDIFITLNVALYSWLQQLRKNLTREMEQVQGAAELRANATPATSIGTARRRSTITDSGPPPELGLRGSLTPAAQRARSPPPRIPNLASSSSRPATLSPPSPTQGQKDHRRVFSLTSFTPWSPAQSPAQSPPQSPPKIQTQSSIDANKNLPPLDTGVLGPAFDLVASPLPKSGASTATSPPSPLSQAPSTSSTIPSPLNTAPSQQPPPAGALEYHHKQRVIERLNMRQLGEATPDVMHPFFMKKAGFSLEDSLPQYVHEFATVPVESVMQALLKLYSKQLGEEGQEVG